MIRKIVAGLFTAVIFMSSSSLYSNAADNPVFSASDGSGTPGEEVTVDVAISNNPGIVSFLVEVEYDTSALELVGAEKSVYDVTFGPDDSIPFVISWFDAVSGNNATDGEIAELTFKIKDDAAVDSYPIRLTYDPDNVFDENESNVWFETSDGYITVLPTSDNDNSSKKEDSKVPSGDSSQSDNNENHPSDDSVSKNDSVGDSSEKSNDDSTSKSNKDSNSSGKSKENSDGTINDDNSITNNANNRDVNSREIINDSDNDNSVTGIQSKVGLSLAIVVIAGSVVIVAKKK